MKFQKNLLLAMLLFCAYSCNLEREIDLGNGYYLLGDHENSVISKKLKNKKGVYKDILLGEIMRYEFNQKYIIVNRQINQKVKMLFQTHPLWGSQNGDENQFWIINKTTEELIGPLDILSFKQAKQKRNIDVGFNN